MLSAAPRGRVAAGLAGRMGGMGTGRRLPFQPLQPLQPLQPPRLARPLGAWAAGASDSGSVRKLADTLDRDPELTMALVEALSKESKIKMANAILDQETKTGIKYSNYLSNKHRRKIMIREISISMNDDIKEKIDVNNDGHVSTEELNHFLDNLIKVQGNTPENGEPATRKQLVQLALLAGIPFVGFGAVDNGIMLIAGDMIDLSLGRALGISTLAAAGLGNLISDVAGIGLGGYIEASSKQLGLKDPRLTLTQMNQRMVRIVQFLATALGISIGCLIGMLPLLFMDPEGPTFKKMWKAVVADDVASTVKVGDLVPMVDTAVEMLGPENRQTIVSKLRESFPSPESDVSLAQFRGFVTELRSSKVIVPLGPMEQFSAELCDMLREEA